MKGIEIFGHCYVYTAYADDTTFFIKDKISVKALINTFQEFSFFSGLKPNIEKCEIGGIGSKGVKFADCGINCVDLTQNTIKILGTHFSYNQTKKDELNFLSIVQDIQNVLKVWRMRSLTLEGKIIVFKSLAISKITYQALLTVIPTNTIKELQKLQQSFLWNNSTTKIKHSTLIKDFNYGGLKNADITIKILSLQFSWMKRLYDDSFHEWKLIPLNYTQTFVSTLQSSKIFLVFTRNSF